MSQASMYWTTNELPYTVKWRFPKMSNEDVTVTEDTGDTEDSSEESEEAATESED